MSQRESKKLKEIIITIICIMLGVGLLFIRMHRLGVFDNIEPPRKEPYVNGIFADETYEKLMDKGYHLEALERAETEKKRTERFVRNELSIQDFKTKESVRFIDGVEFVEFNVCFAYGQNDYELCGTITRYRKNQNVSYSLSVIGESVESMKTCSQMPIDEELINKIGEYIGIKDAYLVFDMNRAKITLNEKTDAYSYTQDFDDYSIEIYEHKEDLYNYVYKIY